jgi:hypothetical protein
LSHLGLATKTRQAPTIFNLLAADISTALKSLKSAWNHQFQIRFSSSRFSAASTLKINFF